LEQRAHSGSLCIQVPSHSPPGARHERRLDAIKHAVAAVDIAHFVRKALYQATQTIDEHYEVLYNMLIYYLVEIAR
jgi:hypothetical protein